MYGTNPTTGQTGTLLLTPEATTSVPPGGDLASRLALTVEPNPFHAVTSIRFSLASPGPVDLAIYDPAGRRVAAVLAGAWRDHGVSEATWDGRDFRGLPVPGGVYFACLRAGALMTHRRLVVLK